MTALASAHSAVLAQPGAIAFLIIFGMGVILTSDSRRILRANVG